MQFKEIKIEDVYDHSEGLNKNSAEIYRCPKESIDKIYKHVVQRANELTSFPETVSELTVALGQGLTFNTPAELVYFVRTVENNLNAIEASIRKNIIKEEAEKAKESGNSLYATVGGDKLSNAKAGIVIMDPDFSDFMESIFETVKNDPNSEIHGDDEDD